MAEVDEPQGEGDESQRDGSDSEDVVVRADSDGQDADSPDPIGGLLKDAPTGWQRATSGFLSISRRTGNPLLEKFNADHIHKVLDYREAGNQRDHQQAHSARWFILAIFLFALVAVVGMLVFLVWQDERELAGQILAGLAIFGGGFGGGYGLGRRR